MKGIVASVLLVLSAVPALGQAEDRRATLERIRGDIASLQAELQTVRQREAGIERQLDETRLELRLQEHRVAEARAAAEATARRIAILEREVAELERNLGEVRGDLRRRLAALYRLGRAGYLRLLLSISSEEDLLPAIRQLRFLARRDGATIDRFVDARVRLDLEREELADSRQRLEAWLVRERRRRAELERLRRERQTVLARVEERRRVLESRSETLENTERKLANLIAFLSGRAGDRVTGRPMTEFRGVLDPPVEAPIAIGFGPRLDPRYGTRTPHNGLEFETRPGQPVHVVYPGKVLFAAPFKGYGRTVIVHHAGGAFTLYARLREVSVRKGDVLRLDDAVGRTGDSFYFEVRIDNRPQDPRRWLRP